LAGVPVADIVARSKARISGRDTFQQHERGEISDTAFLAHVREALEIDLTDAEMLEGWNSIFVGEMPGIRGILSRAGAVLPLFAFSNTNAAHQAHWSAHFVDVLAHFRRIYVSNEIGARKPELLAFQAVAADMGVPPQRILFLDDAEVNVAGARASGMQAVQVTVMADIERALGALGL
jgi:putative hydrolase of the HAD superfamily